MENDYLKPDDRNYWKAAFAITVVAIITFTNLHMMQPLLPYFAQEFSISPTKASLLMSLPIFVTGIFLLVFGSWSDLIGRKRVMVWGFIAIIILLFVSILARSFYFLLVMRILLGLSLAALPSVAMAYISDEVHKLHIGSIMGIYIAGTAMGGMAGRILSGFLVEYLGWEATFFIFALLTVASFILFYFFLPPSEHFAGKNFHLKEEWDQIRSNVGNPLLLPDFLIGMLLQFSFYGIFTYIAFRLADPPYFWSMDQIGLMYLVYVMGMIVTPLFGFFSNRIGLLNLMRIGVTTGIIGIIFSGRDEVLWMIFGLFLFTGGHFTAHSAASSWISSKARQGKGAASGMYLVSYYTGGSLGSTLLGFIWSGWNWSGVEWTVVLVLAFVFPLTVMLAKQERRLTKWKFEHHLSK